MIQVIKRAFDILELLKEAGEMSLGELTGETRLNKGTLCNILRTLTAAGYVERGQRGVYRLSNRFFALARAGVYDAPVNGAVREAVARLSERLGESVVAGTLRGETVTIVHQAQAERKLMVNREIVYENLSLYHSVTGRVLLAYAPPEKRRFCFERRGVPGAEWDGADSFEALEDACGRVRTDGISVMENRVDGIKSFAVPVFDRHGVLLAALALTMPIMRLGTDGGAHVEAALREAAAELMRTAAAFPRPPADTPPSGC